MMTVNELYRHFLRSLESIHNPHEASNISSMVFESIAGISRSALIKDPRQELPAAVEEKILQSLERLLEHMPVQYVLGEAWFYGMKLKVSPAVLIPRPETEELVEEGIAFLQSMVHPHVLDIGTGSGCIAIALKRNVPAAMVTGMDTSESALAIAKENATNLETSIRFWHNDFLDERSWDGRYEMIISNPPYIPVNEKEKMDKNVVAYEPHIALFVDNASPLLFYEKIAAFGKEHLAAGGQVFMETHEALAGDVAALFRENGFDAVIKKDIFEKERMVTATHYQ